MPRPQLHRRGFSREIIETIVLIGAIYALVNLASVRFIVEGPSMQPNFHTGQVLVVTRVNYLMGDPKRGDIAPTCVAHYSKDLSTRLVTDPRFPRGVRPYTVREYARLQGVPDTFTFAGGANDAYRMIGNGVSVPVGEWIGSEIKRYFR